MFVAVPKEDIPTNIRASFRQNTKELLDFVASGLPCAQYILQEGEKAESKASCFKVAATRSNIPVSIVRRGSHIFFVRKEDE